MSEDKKKLIKKDTDIKPLPYPEMASIKWLLKGDPVDGSDTGREIFPDGASNRPISQVMENTLALYDISEGLDVRILELEKGGKGSFVQKITQAGHTFVVGQWLYQDDDGKYALAISNDIKTCAVSGVVSALDPEDVDSFSLTVGGVIDVTGLTLGKDYYLSNDTPGVITSDRTKFKPTDYIVFIGFVPAIDKMFINVDIGYIMSGDNDSDQKLSDDYLQNRSDTGASTTATYKLFNDLMSEINKIVTKTKVGDTKVVYDAKEDALPEDNFAQRNGTELYISNYKELYDWGKENAEWVPELEWKAGSYGKWCETTGTGNQFEPFWSYPSPSIASNLLDSSITDGTNKYSLRLHKQLLGSHLINATATIENCSEFATKDFAINARAYLEKCTSQTDPVFSVIVRGLNVADEEVTKVQANITPGTAVGEWKSLDQVIGTFAPTVSKINILVNISDDYGTLGDSALFSGISVICDGSELVPDPNFEYSGSMIKHLSFDNSHIGTLDFRPHATDNGHSGYVNHGDPPPSIVSKYTGVLTNVVAARGGTPTADMWYCVNNSVVGNNSVFQLKFFDSEGSPVGGTNTWYFNFTGDHANYLHRTGTGTSSSVVPQTAVTGIYDVISTPTHHNLRLQISNPSIKSNGKELIQNRNYSFTKIIKGWEISGDDGALVVEDEENEILCLELNSKGNKDTYPIKAEQKIVGLKEGETITTKLSFNPINVPEKAKGQCYCRVTFFNSSEEEISNIDLAIDAVDEGWHPLSDESTVPADVSYIIVTPNMIKGGVTDPNMVVRFTNISVKDSAGHELVTNGSFGSIQKEPVCIGWDFSVNSKLNTKDAETDGGCAELITGSPTLDVNAIVESDVEPGIVKNQLLEIVTKTKTNITDAEACKLKLDYYDASNVKKGEDICNIEPSVDYKTVTSILKTPYQENFSKVKAIIESDVTKSTTNDKLLVDTCEVSRLTVTKWEGSYGYNFIKGEKGEKNALQIVKRSPTSTYDFWMIKNIADRTCTAGQSIDVSFDYWVETIKNPGDGTAFFIRLIFNAGSTNTYVFYYIPTAVKGKWLTLTNVSQKVPMTNPERLRIEFVIDGQYGKTGSAGDDIRIRNLSLKINNVIRDINGDFDYTTSPIIENSTFKPNLPECEGWVFDKNSEFNQEEAETDGGCAELQAVTGEVTEIYNKKLGRAYKEALLAVDITYKSKNEPADNTREFILDYLDEQGMYIENCQSKAYLNGDTKGAYVDYGSVIRVPIPPTSIIAKMQAYAQLAGSATGKDFYIDKYSVSLVQPLPWIIPSLARISEFRRNTGKDGKSNALRLIKTAVADVDAVWQTNEIAFPVKAGETIDIGFDYFVEKVSNTNPHVNSFFVRVICMNTEGTKKYHFYDIPAQVTTEWTRLENSTSTISDDDSIVKMQFALSSAYNKYSAREGDTFMISNLSVTIGGRELPTNGKFDYADNPLVENPTFKASQQPKAYKFRIPDNRGLFDRTIGMNAGGIGDANRYVGSMQSDSTKDSGLQASIETRPYNVGVDKVIKITDNDFLYNSTPEDYYHTFNTETGEYIDTAKYKFPPFNSTNTGLLQPKESFARIFKNGFCEYIEDNRGMTVYNKSTKASSTVDYLGAIKENYTTKEYEYLEYQVWSEEEDMWVFDESRKGILIEDVTNLVKHHTEQAIKDELWELPVEDEGKFETEYEQFRYSSREDAAAYITTLADKTMEELVELLK